MAAVFSASPPGKFVNLPITPVILDKLPLLITFAIFLRSSLKLFDLDLKVPFALVCFPLNSSLIFPDSPVLKTLGIILSPEYGIIINP